MNTIKKTFLALLVFALVVCFGQLAFALIGSQGGADGSGGITVYPKAHGTKFKGPLTIYYLPAASMSEENGYSTSDLKDMHFFLRLQQKKAIYGFSGIASDVDYLDPAAQQAEIEAFIEETVIPLLYPGVDPAPTALLKSIDKKVEDNELEFPGCCGDGMLFVIMDVVIAFEE